MLAYRLGTGKDLGLEAASELNPDLVPEWDAFIGKALEELPENRYASAQEMLAALKPIREACVQKEAVRAAAAGKRCPRRARRVLGLAAVALVSLLSLASFKSLQFRRVAERVAKEQSTQAAAQEAAQREKAEVEQRRLEAEKVKEKADAETVRLVKEKAVAEVARLAKEKANAEAARLAKEKADAKAAASAAKVKVPIKGEAWTSPATGMEFVWIPALKMWVGTYEVTNGEYRKMVPGHDSKEYKGHSLNGERQPVVYVNFDDAKAYAAWLTERDKDQLCGTRYRVISEQEWQAAAQCGDGREYPWGNAMPPQYGNYSDSASPVSGKIAGYADGFAVTCPVEKSGANERGLYGMGGNAWECCASDASASSFGAWRGASWNLNYPDSLRCAHRLGFGGSTRDENSGFRLALSRAVSVLGKENAMQSAEHKAGDIGMVVLGGDLKLELAWCPAGSFTMGSSADERGDYTSSYIKETKHRVILTKGFWMGKTEVTQRQWVAVMGAMSNPSSKRGADLPVNQVSWYHSRTFIQRLNEKLATEGLKLGRFCLPTEAQWEYACRAGTTGPYAGNRADMGWYSHDDGIHAVGQKKANAWGIYDMHGNVREWCLDWFQEDCGEADVTDPVGPRSGTERVVRGGWWTGHIDDCRSAVRASMSPSAQDEGLRVVLAAP